MHSKLNAAELEKIKSPNGIHLCSDIGVKQVLCDWLLANAPHLMFDMCIAAAIAALCTNGQIATLKCMHRQNLHVDTTSTTITSKYVCKCFVYGKNWYESQVVSGNPLAPLGAKMVQ